MCKSCAQFQAFHWPCVCIRLLHLPGDVNSVLFFIIFRRIFSTLRIRLIIRTNDRAKQEKNHSWGLIFHRQGDMSRADRDPDRRRMLFWWSELSDFELLMRASREKRTHKTEKRLLKKRKSDFCLCEWTRSRSAKQIFGFRALVNGELRKELEEKKFPDLPVARRLSHKTHFNLSAEFLIKSFRLRRRPPSYLVPCDLHSDANPIGEIPSFPFEMIIYVKHIPDSRWWIRFPSEVQCVFIASACELVVSTGDGENLEFLLLRSVKTTDKSLTARCSFRNLNRHRMAGELAQSGGARKKEVKFKEPPTCKLPPSPYSLPTFFPFSSSQVVGCCGAYTINA